MDGKEIKGFGIVGVTVIKDSEAYNKFKEDYQEELGDFPEGLDSYDLDGIKITVVSKDGDA